MKGIYVALVGLWVISCTAVAAPVSPFGQTLGTDTLSSVRNSLGAKTSLTPAGTNHWVDGPMLESDGTGLKIDSLSNVLFIFNSEEVLAGVVLTLNKYRYEDLAASLKRKYTLIDERVPFVGRKWARFREGNVQIDVVAPHMGFDMSVRYLTDEFVAAYARGRANEEREKQKREESQL